MPRGGARTSFQETYIAHNQAMDHAIRIIKASFGDDVSVISKRKSLVKFGRSDAIGTSPATIMTLPSGETSETYVRRNIIDTISSSSSSDIMLLGVEGHTVGDDISVSSITQTSGTAIVTTSSAHGFEAGEWIYVEGANESGYNGIVKVDTVISTTTFTYSVASGTTSPATGTITATSQNKTFVTQEATLDGQNKVTLSTPLARITRMFVKEQNRAANLVGTVYGYVDGAITAGVPNTASSVKIMIKAGKNQSQKASTSLSNQDYWLLTSIDISVLEKTTAFVDVELEVRREGGVFREQVNVTASSTCTSVFDFDPYLIVPKNSDVRLQATAGGANTSVTGVIEGYLAIVENGS